MGLIVGIYRNGDAHPYSLFKDYDAVTVTNMHGPFEPTDDRPAAIMVENPFGDPILMPDVPWMHQQGKCLQVPETESFAASGSYAATSDSRFGEALCAFTGSSRCYYAIPIHDYSFTLEASR